jgi:hypothetical protein
MFRLTCYKGLEFDIGYPLIYAQNGNLDYHDQKEEILIIILSRIAR